MSSDTVGGGLEAVAREMRIGLAGRLGRAPEAVDRRGGRRGCG